MFYPFKPGDVVMFCHEWRAPGEQPDRPYIIRECFPDEINPNNDYYYVSPLDSNMVIIPVETVRGFMIRINPYYSIEKRRVKK